MVRSFMVMYCGISLEAAEPWQYIVFNRAPGQGMHQGEPDSLGRKAFDEAEETSRIVMV
jgi:hypothetical protein